jgi:uncharacterized damage-inducible protein DinB
MSLIMNKQTLLKQFAACYDENVWFVAVRNVLDGVTAEQAIYKPEGTNNSIWESLAHLTYYNNAYLLRFKGVNYEYEKADNDATFEAPADPLEDDWTGEIEKFDAVMREFRSLIEAAEESRFGEHVSAKNKASWGELISNINAHNAYHGGQMLLMRKLQGSWNPEKGVS